MKKIFFGGSLPALIFSHKCQGETKNKEVENNMKKRYCVWLLIALSVLLMSACGTSERASSSENVPETNSVDKDTGNTSEELLENTPEESGEEVAENSSEETGESQMKELIIEVGGQRFQASLYDNETAQEFMKRLPMTLNMEELHGNEKYYYLDEGLPTNVESIGRIQTGDIMLFGSDCLVLFYDDFSTSYSYTRIGHIEDAEALADVLGNGSVEVVFEAEE